MTSTGWIDNNCQYKVSISLKRVQTFIFDVPRLKAMLGANALIGESLRHKLTKLLFSDEFKSGLQTLTWPESVQLTKEPDLLADCFEHDSIDQDSPRKLFEMGIITRDGGHFEAIFNDIAIARKFLKQAVETLSAMLPGVVFDAEIEGETPLSASETNILDLPVFQICQATGKTAAAEPGKNNWASEDNQSDDQTDLSFISASVNHRLKAGIRFYRRQTADIIGLMSSSLYSDKWKQPEDLSDLASGDYLALIHADGNRIGERSGGGIATSLEQEASTQAFFHSMRISVRNALVKAISETFPVPVSEGKHVRPYEILMLGGDDLVLVCRANYALKFANNYTNALKEFNLTDGKPLDVGIGVAIAKKTFPINRLNTIAESLQTSAKRLSRSLNSGSSTIDWQVITQSWFDDIRLSRKKADLVSYKTAADTETLILSQRPYSSENLSELLTSSDHLLNSVTQDQGNEDNDSGSGRTQLRSMRAACNEGRLTAELAFANLKSTTQKALGGKLWKSESQGSSAATSSEAPVYYSTRALDIIDVFEISKLGTTTKGAENHA